MPDEPDRGLSSDQRLKRNSDEGRIIDMGSPTAIRRCAGLGKRAGAAQPDDRRNGSFIEVTRGPRLRLRVDLATRNSGRHLGGALTSDHSIPAE